MPNSECREPLKGEEIRIHCLLPSLLTCDKPGLVHPKSKGKQIEMGSDVDL